MRNKTKNLRTKLIRRRFGAASQIRTGDLILTKDALYRLSYSSTNSLLIISHSMNLSTLKTKNHKKGCPMLPSGTRMGHCVSSLDSKSFLVRHLPL